MGRGQASNVNGHTLLELHLNLPSDRHSERHHRLENITKRTRIYIDLETSLYTKHPILHYFPSKLYIIDPNTTKFFTNPSEVMT